MTAMSESSKRATVRISLSEKTSRALLAMSDGVFGSVALSGTMSDAVVGIACALGSVALFGTNYLPVKRYDVGDGFFFQWCLCLGIWLVGLAVDLAHVNSAAPPPFEPLAVLGGVLWCTGQLTVVTIVQTIGIAKGLIVWGSTAM